MTTTTKIPPHNLDAERSVLGCMLMESSKIDSVTEFLKDEDFYADANKTIFKAILSLHADEIETDVVTVADKLESSGKLDEVGGLPELLTILETVQHSAHVGQYVEIVLENSRRRKAIAISKRLEAGAYDQTSDIESVYALAEKTAESLSGELAMIQKNRVTLLADEVKAAIDRIETGVPDACSVTIPEIDAETGGISLGEMIVIAARPGQGKSMVALQIVDNAASLGVPCLIVSEEMTKQQLANRSLSFLSSIEKKDRIENIGMLRFEAADHFRNKAPILIADKCFHISAVERHVAKAVKTHGVQIVAIDYAQLLKGDGDQKHLQVGDVSTRCKNLCTRFNIIILLLVQLGREFERRTDDGPKLSDLQHSSQLEQDADQVWALFWPAKTDKSYEDKEEFRVYFLKNRHRPIKDAGVIKMTVNAARQRITGFIPYDGGFQ